MRQKKTRRWVWAAGVAVVGGLPFACVSIDNTGGLGDCANPIGGIVCPSAGSMGASGTGGASGDSGGGTGGTSGTPAMGTGGGGTGGTGGGGCVGDTSCDVANGSLCVGGTCTKALGACDAKAFVVVEQSDEALAAAESRDACFFRALAPALTAVGTETQRVAVYAATSVTVPTPITVPSNVALDGHTAEPGKAVALEVAALTPGVPLVTMAPGSGLKGIALDGKGTSSGVLASSGAVRFDGPLRVASTTLAIELTGNAVATVRGAMTTPVIVTSNLRGIDVAQSAGLDLEGDGEAGGVLVETTGMSAGILIRAGDTAIENKLIGLLAKDNIGSTSNGTGAVEVRQGRKVTISGSVFRKNNVAISLNGENNSQFASFSNVLVSGSVFENPSPTTGTAICGSGFSGEIQLALGPVNTFPSNLKTPDDCTALGSNQGGACNGGNDVSVIDLAKLFNLTCSGGA
jgi:hypothetical protein